MEKIELTNEIFESLKNSPEFINGIKNHHAEADKDSNFKNYLAFGKYPIKYYFTEHAFIDRAKKIHARMKEDRLNIINKSTLIHFIPMGMSFDTKEGYINNHRIRCYFYNNDNKYLFLEIGTARDKDYLRIDFSQDVKNKKYNYKGLERFARENQIKYKYDNVLNIINKNLNCSYTGLKIEDCILSPEDFINSLNND